MKVANERRKTTVQEPGDGLQDVVFENGGAYLLGFHLLGRNSFFATMMLFRLDFINGTFFVFQFFNFFVFFDYFECLWYYQGTYF